MMKDKDAIALGRRALAAGFRWAPGVLVRDDDGGFEERLGVALVNPKYGVMGWYMAGRDDSSNIPDDAWPDFRDPATVGVLVSQTRRKHPKLYAMPHRDGWAVFLWDELVGCGLNDSHDSEAEAWVAALEASL